VQMNLTPRPRSQATRANAKLLENARLLLPSTWETLPQPDLYLVRYANWVGGLYAGNRKLSTEIDERRGPAGPWPVNFQIPNFPAHGPNIPCSQGKNSLFHCIGKIGCNQLI
jgi:hypothetical protein